MTDRFPTDPTGLPACGPPDVVELRDGDELELRIGPVAKRLGDLTVRMLAYSGSIPGPVLRVGEGSEIAVHVVNEGDLETTVHWHGLRLDNRYDGTHETQEPIPVGGRFTYRLTFPDPGAYWYHPHIRQDYGQELGLYGTIVVAPSSPDYWPAVDREVALTLDDVLIEDGKVAPFSRSETDYAAMGRYGNVMLVNGEPDLSLAARQGEVVRFYLTNTANTRVFDVGIPGARMKLVGGDSGHVEREAFVDGVVLGPSERAVVDVLFEAAGPLVLEHRTPQRVYRLATIAVGDSPADGTRAGLFGALRTNPDMVAERERIGPLLAAEPDKTLALVAEMDLGSLGAPGGEDAGYVCPMHPEVTSAAPDRCPACGMKLVPRHLVEAAGGHEHGHAHDHGTGTTTTTTTGTTPVATAMTPAATSTTGTTARATRATAAAPTPAASSGRTTWSRSTA